MLRDLVVKQGGELLVMFLPSKEELFGVPTAVAAGNVVARTRERLQEANFAVLDLHPMLRTVGSQRPLYFPADIHLNEYGNRLVAEMFLAWFNARPRPQKQ